MPIPESFNVPENATNTLYIKGIPLDTKRREVAHIFRPYPGYIEVRLVKKFKDGN